MLPTLPTAGFLLTDESGVRKVSNDIDLSTDIPAVNTVYPVGIKKDSSNNCKLVVAAVSDTSEHNVRIFRLKSDTSPIYTFTIKDGDHMPYPALEMQGWILDYFEAYNPLNGVLISGTSVFDPITQDIDFVARWKSRLTFDVIDTDILSYVRGAPTSDISINGGGAAENYRAAFGIKYDTKVFVPTNTPIKATIKSGIVQHSISGIVSSTSDVHNAYVDFVLTPNPYAWFADEQMTEGLRFKGSCKGIFFTFFYNVSRNSDNYEEKVTAGEVRNGYAGETKIIDRGTEKTTSGGPFVKGRLTTASVNIKKGDVSLGIGSTVTIQTSVESCFPTIVLYKDLLCARPMSLIDLRIDLTM